MPVRSLAYGLCLLALVAPSLGQAGAWPRGKGKAFLSVAVEQTAPRDYAQTELMTVDSPHTAIYKTLYGELGLTDRLTFGVDVGQGAEQQILSFLSLSVVPQGFPLQVAFDAAIGTREYGPQPYNRILPKAMRDGGIEQVARAGVSLGYGFTLFEHNGWTTLDVRQEYRFDFEETVHKIDWTLGVTRPKGELVYLQSQYSEYPGSRAKLRLVPTHAKEVAPETLPGVWLELAGLFDAMGGDDLGVRAAIWLEF